MTLLQDAFRQCFDIFSGRIHPVGGNSIMCQLHGMLGADCQQSHNCLGCNLNEATGAICDYLAQYERFQYENDVYNSYFYCLTSID